MIPAGLLALGFAPDLAALARAAIVAFGPVSVRAGDPDPTAPENFLVLTDSAAGRAAEWSVELDAQGLPRWGVVVLPETDEAATAALLRAGWELYRLQRENARLRGDLRTFARRVSHDLRSPLGGVLTLSQVLQEVIPQESAEALDLLGSIVRSAEKMSSMIDRVSALARASTQPVAHEPVAMGELLSRVRTKLEFAARAKDARIEVAGGWPVVHGDAALIEIIWWNLLGNAIQHATAPARIELGWRSEGDERVFYVRDSGPGLPEARRAPAQRQFHRLHEANTGHGFGLSIVDRFVALHGGRCFYEDSPSTFSFTLPAVGVRSATV